MLWRRTINPLALIIINLRWGFVISICSRRPQNTSNEASKRGSRGVISNVRQVLWYEKMKSIQLAFVWVGCIVEFIFCWYHSCSCSRRSCVVYHVIRFKIRKWSILHIILITIGEKTNNYILIILTGKYMTRKWRQNIVIKQAFHRLVVDR